MDDLDIASALPSYQNDRAGKSKGLSSYVKGAIGLLATGTVDMMAGFSTAYWATWTKENGQHGGYGIWKTWQCHKSFEQEDNGLILDTEVCEERLADIYTPFPAWHVAVQVLQTLAMAGMVASLIMLLLYMFLPKWERNHKALSGLIATSYISGLFTVVTFFVFGFKVAEDLEEMGIKYWILSWSFSLSCTGFVLNQIAASILVTECKRLIREEEENKQIVKEIKEELRAILISEHT